MATFLTPNERSRVDAAGHGCYVALHRESLEDLMVDLRTRAVSAVLVSVARYQTQHATQVARLVREFPRVPAVALLTTTEPRTTQSVLALGQHGVRSLVDARDPKGWRELREFVASEQGDLIEQRALARIREELMGAPADCLRFFEALFLSPSHISTVQQIARANGVVPSTLMSRFFREKLPAPKRYLAMARLVRAARLFENPGLSITHVANHLEYSSAQSFSRHVSLLMGCTPMQFRRQFDGARMLDAMCDQLVRPYREILLRFEPYGITPQWSVLREAH
ncbi:MAG: helix-turn-helix transcriptional regulator [Gemmatimonadaceae bacterium]|nr:helix-turn-helix transcriptional regulator [Gemmatimonadaceae bacterium]